MYVDKPLKGLHAVQTLSRLNGIHPEKTDTFVLDFRNEVEDIQKAFEPYYGHTAAVPTDPNLLYDTRGDLDTFDVLRREEIEPAARLAASLASERDHPKLYALLDPALDRFKTLTDDGQDEFRGALQRFLNAYRFLAQIVSYTDTRLERYYLYCRALHSLLPGTTTGRLDLGKDVQLTHLRLERTWQGSATLEDTDGQVRVIFDGRGKQHDPDTEKLSQIVELINERFGLNSEKQTNSSSTSSKQHGPQTRRSPPKPGPTTSPTSGSRSTANSSTPSSTGSTPTTKSSNGSSTTRLPEPPRRLLRTQDLHTPPPKHRTTRHHTPQRHLTAHGATRSARLKRLAVPPSRGAQRPLRLPRWRQIDRFLSPQPCRICQSRAKTAATADPKRSCCPQEVSALGAIHSIGRPYGGHSCKRALLAPARDEQAAPPLRSHHPSREAAASTAGAA